MANFLKKVTKLLTLKNLLIVVFAIGVAAAVYMALYGNIFEGFENQALGEDCDEDNKCADGLTCEGGKCVEPFAVHKEKKERPEGAETAATATAPTEGEAEGETGDAAATEPFMNPQMGAHIANAVNANHNVAGVAGFEEGAAYASINEEESRPEMPRPKNPASCFPRDSLNPGELLPKEQGEYAAFAPMGQGNLAGRNFLEAGKQIGVDTVGQSLRNANYQLRSEPPNPRMAVSVFNNSTIAPDNSRRQLEIGSSA
jgi:hypothetical protein